MFSFHHPSFIFLLWLFSPSHLSASFCSHISIFVLTALFFFPLFCLHYSGCLIPSASIFVSSAVSASFLLLFITLSASESNPLFSLSDSHQPLQKLLCGNGAVGLRQEAAERERESERKSDCQSFSGQTMKPPKWRSYYFRH